MKNIKTLLDYHFLFLYIGLVFGLQLVYVNPPWHTNDEDRHFYNAYALSNGQIGPMIQDGKIGLMMPVALENEVVSYQGRRFNDSLKMPKKLLRDAALHSLNKSKSAFTENVSAGICPIGYLPSAIFIRIATFLNLSPIEIGYWGRIGSLLAYLVIVFFAIKITPQFKPVLFLVALSPMALYQGASVTYDTLNLALLFLIFAFTLKFYFQKEKVVWKQILWFFAIAFTHRFVKEGYLFLYFLPLFVGISKFENKRLFYISLVLIIVAGFLPGKIWEFYLNQLHLPVGISMQNDFLFDLSKNIQFQMSNPMNAIQNICNNIFNQSKVWIIGSIGRFGYSYTKLPDWLGLVVFLSFIFATVIENTTTTALRVKFRLIILFFVCLNALALIVFFYLNSPVGASVIFGLQGRYFTPLLPFLITMAFYIDSNKKSVPYIKIIIPALAIFNLLFTVSFLNERFFF